MRFSIPLQLFISRLGGDRNLFRNPNCFIVLARKRNHIIEAAVQTEMHKFSLKKDSPELSKMVRTHDLARGNVKLPFVIQVFQSDGTPQLLGEASCSLDELQAQALSDNPCITLLLHHKPVGILTIVRARLLVDISGGLALNMPMEEREYIRQNVNFRNQSRLILFVLP